MQRADKSTFDTRYYGVYTRGKGGNKMVAGVKSASQNEILPYSVEINSKDGVLIRAVDMSKVRDRLATAMNKPQFKAAYDNPVDALKDLRKYMDNITQINAVDSATLLGGGVKGATKRNLFYEALGFRLRNGETLLNAPDSVVNKSQNTIKSYRAERFAKLVDSGNKFAFEEATTYERALRNFQPSAFTPESLPNGESFTNPDGYRILNKAGSKLFRTYDDTGKLIGIAESKEKAMKKAQDEFAKKAMKEEPATSKSPTEMRFQTTSQEQGKPNASSINFDQQGLDDSPIRSILGGSLKFNPKKVNEKYYTEATKAAKAYGAGADFIQSRQSEVSGQVRDQMDRLRSEKLRSDDAILQQFIDAFPSHKVKQGGEHITYIPDDGDFVLKFTKPSDESGVGFAIDEDIGQGFDQKEFRRLGFRQAAVSEYIARTANFSKLFDVPWQVTEVVQNQLGQPVIVSVMKKIEGDVLTRDKADLKLIRDYMAKRGFKQLAEGPMTYHKNYEHIPESTYYNPNTGELISDVEPRNFIRTKSGKIEPVDLVMNVFNPKYEIRYQPDPTSPNILNGTDGSRIIKSTSGKYRVYLATGALAGVKDTLESAQKLVQSKSK